MNGVRAEHKKREFTRLARAGAAHPIAPQQTYASNAKPESICRAAAMHSVGWSVPLLGLQEGEPGRQHPE